MMTLFSGPITGRKAFAIFSSFFVVIIAVNLVLAWQAIATFPGLEVQNSYVASQSFDADRAAQESLGWQARATLSGDTLRLVITDASGAPVAPASLTGLFGRATMARDDQVPVWLFDGQTFTAPVVAGAGRWILHVRAQAADGTEFRQRLDVTVAE